MPTFISLTRLRLRSIRFLPQFAWHAIRSNLQVQRAHGFLLGSLLPDRSLTFWTMTAWDSESSMRAYMISGPHKAAMPYLMHWCDEASVAHWMETDPNVLASLPSWTEADRRMRASGRTSNVLHPSPQHATLNYRAPRVTAAAPIRRRA